MAGIILCYHPPARHRTDNMTRMEVVKRIDWVGALLSIGGVTLFLVALQAGGYQYAWTNGRVLGPLIVGLAMILAFPFWELHGARFPMVPREIFEGQRIVALSLVLSLVAGKLTLNRRLYAAFESAARWESLN